MKTFSIVLNVLTLLLLILRATGVIAWKWYLVTAPSLFWLLVCGGIFLFIWVKSASIAND